MTFKIEKNKNRSIEELLEMKGRRQVRIEKLKLEIRKIEELINKKKYK